MANVKISDLTAYVDPASSDILPIVDLVNDVTKKVTIADLLENAGDGSAAAPAFAFNSDSNTGIYRSGADELSFATGGTQRLVIDSSGNVSVGGSNVVTVGDTGTVTSAMILDGTIVNADINASAEIAVSKLANGTARQLLQTASNGSDVEFTSNVDVPGTLDVTGAATLDSTLGVAGLISANGKVSFPLGSASAPSLLPGTDTNTGIFSPGADALAITTAGTQRVTVDSSGNVGVGVTNPQTGLHISDGSSLAGPQTTGAGRLTIQNSSSADIQLMSANTGYNHIFFGDQDDANAGVIYYQHNSGVNAMVFTTNAAERLRIDSSGRLGIGTSTPQSLLSINGANTSLGSSSTLLNIGNQAFGINTYRLIGFGYNSSTHPPAFIGYQETNASTNTFGDLVFGTRSVNTNTVPTERMRIDSLGNVGIGLTSPQTKFHSSGITNGAQATFGISSSGLKISTFQKTGNDAGVILDAQEATNGTLAFSTRGSERMRIDSSGNVGIGTTTPLSDAKLTISSNDAPALAFQRTGSGKFESAIGMSGNSSLRFYVGADSGSVSGLNEAMQIDSSGRVGIGETSMDALLVIKGNSDANTTPSIRLKDGTDTREAWITNTAGDLVLANGGNDNVPHCVLKMMDGNFMSFHTANTERMRIDSSGRLLVGASSSSQVNTAVFQGNSAGGSGPGVILASSINNPSSTQVLGKLAFSDNGHVDAASIKAARDQGTWTSGSSQPSSLAFFTTADGSSSPTERLKIDSSGRLLLGATAPVSGADANGLLQVSQNVGSNTCIIVAENTASSGNLSCFRARLRNSNPNSIFSAFLQCDASTGGSKAVIRSNGGLANYSANNVNLSDRNVKKDITAAADTWDCIKEWEIVNFRYKDQPDNADLNLGVIAQQVAESCPEVLTIFQEAKEATETEPAQEERLGVKEQQMHWMAIKALQEAIAKIETLEQRLSDAGIA